MSAHGSRQSMSHVGHTAVRTVCTAISAITVITVITVRRRHAASPPARRCAASLPVTRGPSTDRADIAWLSHLPPQIAARVLRASRHLQSAADRVIDRSAVRARRDLAARRVVGSTGDASPDPERRPAPTSKEHHAQPDRPATGPAAASRDRRGVAFRIAAPSAALPTGSRTGASPSVAGLRPDQPCTVRPTVCSRPAAPSRTVTIRRVACIVVWTADTN